MEGSLVVGFRRLPIKTRRKKRTLEESGIVIDVEKEVVVLSHEEFDFRGTKKVKVRENAKGKEKGKQVMIPNVIDLDNDHSLADTTNKVKLGGNYKGKCLIYLSDGDESDEENACLFKKHGLSSMTAGTTGTADEIYLNNLSKASSRSYKDGYSYVYKADYFEHLPQNWSGQNHAYSSAFAADSTELSERTTTPAANTVHEAAMKRTKQFVNFAIVGDFSDHHYAKNFSTHPRKAWVKKIQNEWKILQSRLPETIFVRACESKMPLLRAAIIGPQGTPYHDGLFFFDLMFPSTYPHEPPQVYYHSGGLRLNPNLYNCGKVCLSLLGTWPGQSAAENWIPGKSTMLQVLVSIQAIILNAKPYFNEPGYSGHGGFDHGEKASQRYNEDTLIKSLKTMLYSLRRPPKHFEDFVKNHFITRSHDILLACKAYMEGAQVGSVSIVEGKAIRENKNWCSPSLKNNVEILMNPLIDEFAKIGVKKCEEFRTPESNSKNEESTGISRGKSQFPPHLKSALEKITKSKPKYSSAFKSAPTPPAVSAAYSFPPPPVAWNPSTTTAWISPSAFHASSASMFSLPQFGMPNVLQNMSDANAGRKLHEH